MDFPNPVMMTIAKPCRNAAGKAFLKINIQKSQKEKAGA